MKLAYWSAALAAYLIPAIAGIASLQPLLTDSQHQSQLSSYTLPVPSDVSNSPGSKAGFLIRLKGEIEFPYRISLATVMPGDPLSIEALAEPAHAAFSADAASGSLVQAEPARWTWTAPPTPGVYPIRITDMTSQETSLVNALVLTPAPRSASLNGYRIGRYPARPLKNNPIYLPPAGFIEITENNQDLQVSPHFRLGQFLCKQPSAFPKYLLLDERLVLKLEAILDKLRDRGHELDTLHVMSGFRTPAYNTGLKNARYSMHQWGYAADVFLDQSPADNRMDDLNLDGTSDYRDAAVLRSIVDEMDRADEQKQLTGGLGAYKSTKAHGPFVHVDVRGWEARWGVGR